MRAAIILLALFAQQAVTEKPVTISIADLVEKAQSYDMKEIETTGKVVKCETRTSKAGNPYFTFKLEEKGKRLSIFGWGTLTRKLKDGEIVKLTGTFRKEHLVSGNLFKLEVETEAEKIKIQKPADDAG
ncbi:hypothetical protein BH11ARM1_BH11ARM1_05180 [soil metagenome]